MWRFMGVVRIVRHPWLMAGILPIALLAAALANVPAQAKVLTFSGMPKHLAPQLIDRAVQPVRRLPSTLASTDPASATQWVKEGRGVAVAGENRISMSLVQERGTVARSSVSERVVLNSGRQSDSVIQRTRNGGRIIEIIQSRNAPSSFSYRLAVPAGQKLVQLADGSILVGTETRAGSNVTIAVTGILSRAWARDVHDQPVPVRYTIDHTTVTMHVDHLKVAADSYPIVADPTLTTGGWQASYSLIHPASVTLKANKYRTSQIAGSEGSLACGAVAFIPTIGGPLAFVCAVDIYLMHRAYRAGYCVGDRINIITRQGSVFIYRGGFCT